jgi:hemerythrin
MSKVRLFADASPFSHYFAVGGKRVMFMPWNDELLTGIAQVDEQHKWLVDATTRLHEEVTKAAPDNAVVGEILEGLVDYTYNHFIMEEDMFQRLGYPETEAHRAQHNVFTNRITELLAKHDKGEVASTDALDLLKNWLLQHILKTDKAYVPFLKSKGA